MIAIHCFNMLITISLYSFLFAPFSLDKEVNAINDTIVKDFANGKLCVVRNGTSSVWQHFKVLESGLHPTKAICNLCQKIVARGSSASPSNLNLHMNCHH